MQRLTVAPRPNWRERVEELGLVWHSAGGRPYWDESACYAFSLSQIERIERAAAELHDMFLVAGQHVLDRDLLSRFGIPDFCHDAIRDSWEAEPPALNYGRFDFGYDGSDAPACSNIIATRRPACSKPPSSSGIGRTPSFPGMISSTACTSA